MASIEKVSQSVSQSAGGFPLVSILTVIFVLAKLAGVIDWSWWWVFSPLWIGFAVFFGIIAVIGIGFLLFAGIGISIAGVIDFMMRRDFRG